MKYIHSHSFILSSCCLILPLQFTHHISCHLLYPSGLSLLIALPTRFLQASGFLSYGLFYRSIFIHSHGLNTICIFIILKFMYLVRICFWQISNWRDISTWISQYNLNLFQTVLHSFNQFSSIQRTLFPQVRNVWDSFLADFSYPLSLPPLPHLLCQESSWLCFWNI